MPVHDWSQVSAGTFHAFHVAWIGEIQTALNARVLPPDYYALAEQIAGPYGPDILTLQTDQAGEQEAVPLDRRSTSVATAPPRARVVARTEMDEYTLRRRTLVIRHGSDDRIVALLEIVSPGNKASRHALRSFVTKAAEALYRGYHLLIVDLHPPGPRDPQGIHGAIWSEISDEDYIQPADKPLTLASYSADVVKTAYVEPVAVGDVLPDSPLFLEPEEYVNVPLEATYAAAWEGMPQRWRRVLEGR